jgi:hypothetical protein
VRRSGLIPVVLALAFAGEAEGAVRTVTTTGDPGPAGTLSLRQAITFAAPGDTIDIPPGNYALAATGRIQIDKSLTIQGAGAGATAVRGGASSTGIFRVINPSSVVTFTRLRIADGRHQGVTVGRGVGLEMFDGQVTLSQVALTGNRALGNRQNFGGGILMFAGFLTIESSEVSQNVAAGGDGGGADSQPGQGGGLYSQGGTLAIRNSTFTGNRAEAETGAGAIGGQGGGAFISNTASATWVNSTLAANTVTQAGGFSGGGNLDATGSVMNQPRSILRNTIVSAGVGLAGRENCFQSGGIIESQGGNVESLAQCDLDQPSDRPNTDPLLAPLDLSAPTAFFPLMPGSQAIDRGVPTSCTGVDQRGLPRPLGASCESGASEVIPPPSATTGSATEVGARSATLAGTINPWSLTGSAAFQFGTSVAYGSQVAAAPFPAGIVPGNTQASLTGLRPDTVYHYRLTAETAAGSGAGPDVTFRTLRNPSVTGVRSSRRRWRRGSRLPRTSARRRRAPVGTTLSFRLDRAVSVQLEFLAIKPGRRVGRACRPPSRANRRRPRCTRLVRAGLLRFEGHAGINRVAFQGRLSRRVRLKLGPYRFRVVATAADGARATSATAPFTIVR